MNGMTKKMAGKVAIGLTIVLALGIAGMATEMVTDFDVFLDGGSGAADEGGNGGLASLPPLPGLDASDLGPSTSIEFIGVSAPAPPQVALDTFGLHSVALNGSVYLTIRGINPYVYTTVRWAELYPDGQWRIFDLSGSYPTGQLPTSFFADTVGRHVVLIWADNNGNGLVERYEVTVPYLTVDVTSNTTSYRIIIRF